jgi:hypothetical protein
MVTDLAGKSMCPHCGKLFRSILNNGLIPRHTIEINDTESCPGSGQNPRNPESDFRLLWNGEPNPHVERPEPRKVVEPPTCECGHAQVEHTPYPGSQSNAYCTLCDCGAYGLRIDCDRCDKPLTEPGGLAFGPPSLASILVTKRHICVDCWFDFCGWMDAGSDR